MSAPLSSIDSLKRYRYRVHCLARDLWKEKDPIGRSNLALQLADAATSLARLEVQEARSDRDRPEMTIVPRTDEEC